MVSGVLLKSQKRFIPRVLWVNLGHARADYFLSLHFCPGISCCDDSICEGSPKSFGKKGHHPAGKTSPLACDEDVPLVSNLVFFLGLGESPSSLLISLFEAAMETDDELLSRMQKNSKMRFYRSLTSPLVKVMDGWGLHACSTNKIPSAWVFFSKSRFIQSTERCVLTC